MAEMQISVSQANIPQSPEKHRIGVVTVTFNSAKVLPDFLDSVAAQSCREFILYVVDNDSRDETLQICSGWQDIPIRIISNQANVGVAEGNNQGIRAALGDGCEFVLLLNNDTTFTPALFEQLLNGMARYGCAMITPKIYYHSEPSRIWAAGGCFQAKLGYRIRHYGGGQVDRGQFKEVRTVTYTPTCCVMIQKDVFARIGLMDPSYFVYVDDVDFMYRAYKDGITMKYLPNATLWHKVSALTGATSSFEERFCTRNRIYFMRKHLSARQARFWKLMYQAYYTLRLLMRRDSVSSWKLKRSSAREGWNLSSGE